MAKPCRQPLGPGHGNNAIMASTSSHSTVNRMIGLNRVAGTRMRRKPRRIAGRQPGWSTFRGVEGRATRHTAATPHTNATAWYLAAVRGRDEGRPTVKPKTT